MAEKTVRVRPENLKHRLERALDPNAIPKPVRRLTPEEKAKYQAELLQKRGGKP